MLLVSLVNLCPPFVIEETAAPTGGRVFGFRIPAGIVVPLLRLPA